MRPLPNSTMLAANRKCGVLIFLLTTILGCGDQRSEISSPTESVAEINSAFALDLYSRLKENEGNVLFSPLNVSESFGILYLGARNVTERELATTFHFNLPQEELRGVFAALTSRMGKFGQREDITLTFANSIWCDRNYVLKKDFLSALTASFQAEAYAVEFDGPPEAACNEINAWVSKKTNRKIRQSLMPSQIGANTRMVLCSAIYFNGHWAVQFDPKDTRTQQFFVAAQQPVTIPMMHQKSSFKTAHVDHFKLLELPYVGNDLSMIILLPDTYNGLSSLESKFQTNNVRDWLSQLDQNPKQNTIVWLPRFRITQNIDLANELVAMGAPSIFSAKDADLSGIAKEPGLCVSGVIHQSFIEVDEVGTKAAAATSSSVKSRSMSDVFNADHPFIFLIRENRTGTILFLGRLSDPLKS